MKKNLVPLLAFCFLTFAPISFGQTQSNEEITVSFAKSFDDNFTFSAVKSVRNEKMRETQFIENVSFSSSKFEFSGADKVIYNEATKKMTVYGCQDFTINGKVVIKNVGTLKNILEYTVGKDTVYLF